MRASFNEPSADPAGKVHPSTRADHGPRSVGAPLDASVQQTPLVGEPLDASRSMDLARGRSLRRGACPPNRSSVHLSTRSLHRPLVGAPLDASRPPKPPTGAPFAFDDAAIDFWRIPVSEAPAPVLGHLTGV